MIIIMFSELQVSVNSSVYIDVSVKYTLTEILQCTLMCLRYRMKEMLLCTLMCILGRGRRIFYCFTLNCF